MQKFYIPKIKSKMSSMLSNIGKNYGLRFFQLNVGYGAIENLFARIKVVETPEC